MHDRRGDDRLYTVILMAFLVALVGLGLFGVPAPQVAGIGLVAAALAIAVFHRRLEGRGAHAQGRMGKRSPIPAKYVPSVLESSSVRRRRTIHLRRRNHADQRLRFR